MHRAQNESKMRPFLVSYWVPKMYWERSNEGRKNCNNKTEAFKGTFMSGQSRGIKWVIHTGSTKRSVRSGTHPVLDLGDVGGSLAGKGWRKGVQRIEIFSLIGKTNGKTCN